MWVKNKSTLSIFILSPLPFRHQTLHLLFLLSISPLLATKSFTFVEPPSQKLCLFESQIHFAATQHHDDELSTLDGDAGAKTRSRHGGEPCFDSDVLVWFQMKQLVSILPLDRFRFLQHRPLSAGTPLNRRVLAKLSIFRIK